MILKCPLDDFVLDEKDAETMTLFVKSGETMVVWSPCPSRGLAPHWVSAFFHENKTVTLKANKLVAVPPRVSHLPDHGLSSAPPPERSRSSRVPPMVIRKRETHVEQT